MIASAMASLILSGTPFEMHLASDKLCCTILLPLADPGLGFLVRGFLGGRSAIGQAYNVREKKARMPVT